MYIIYFVDQKGNAVGRWEVEELPEYGLGIVLSKDIYFIESLTIKPKEDNIIPVEARVIDILSWMKKSRVFNPKS